MAPVRRCCLYCSASRLACDGRSPCATCIAKGRRAQDCTYNWTDWTQILALFPPHQCLNRKLRVDLSQAASGLLSGGSFGQVWKTTLGNESVVVKVPIYGILRKHSEDRVLELWVREALVWSNLRHPNVASFMGVGDSSTILVGGAALPRHLSIVSKYAPQGSIMDYLEKEPDSERLSMVASIAEGVSYLHSHSAAVVHGDLKGNNILVEIRDNVPVPLITDFGLSQVMDELLFPDDTSTSTSGNARWKAKERMDPQKYGFPNHVAAKTTASDIYELMRTILQVCTGSVPFPRIPISDFVILEVLDGRSPPRPTECEWIDDELWGAMLFVWDCDPRERPDAENVLELLQRKVQQRASEEEPDPEDPMDTLIQNSVIDIPTLLGALSARDQAVQQNPAVVFQPASMPQEIPPLILQYLSTVRSHIVHAAVDELKNYLPLNTWQHVYIIANTPDTCSSWVNFVLTAGIPPRLETLELDGPIAISNLGALLQALPSLTSLRLSGSVDPLLQPNTPLPTLVGALERLELRNLAVNYAQAVMQMYRRHPIGHLAFISIHEGDVLQGVPPADAQFRALREFISERWGDSISELSIHTHQWTVKNSREENHLRFLLGKLPNLQWLTLRGSRAQDLRSILGNFTPRYPSPAFPRLNTLRLGGYDPEAVVNCLAGFRKEPGQQRLHYLLIDGREFKSFPTLQAAQCNDAEINVRHRLGRAVQQVGAYEGDGLYFAWVPGTSNHNIYWRAIEEEGDLYAPWPLHPGRREFPPLGWGVVPHQVPTSSTA